MSTETPSAESARPVPGAGFRVGERATTKIALVLTREPSARWRVAALVALVVIAVAAYWGSLSNGFVWDDWDHLFEIDEWGTRLVPNSDITSIRGVIGSLKDLESGASEPSRQVFRPLRTLSYALDYARSGLEAGRLHATNLLLHVLTVLAAYLAVRRLTGGFFVAITAAGFFALHPVHTEAVDHISNRADLLAAPLLFLALASYAKRREGRGPLAWGPAVGLYLAAVFCKETAAVFPAALLLYDWAMPPEGRSSRRHLRTRLIPYSAFALACAVYLVARRSAMGPPEFQEAWGGSYGATAMMMVGALARYARLVLFPLRLCARHQIPPVESLLEPEFIGGAIVAVVVTVTVLWSFRRWPVVVFGVGWFFIFLLPVSNVVIPVPGAMVAEHWLYMPAFGIAALFGWALGGVMRRVYRTGSAALFVVAVVVLLAVMIFFGTRTALRHDVWRDNETLFGSILEVNPADTKVRLSLGRYYWLMRQLDDAELQYRRVVELDPENAEARFRLGSVSFAKAALDQAEDELSRAVAADPEHAQAHFYLAQTLEAQAAKLAAGAAKAPPGDQSAEEEAARRRRRAAEHYRRFVSIVEAGPVKVPPDQKANAKIRLQALEGHGVAPGPGDGD